MKREIEKSKVFKIIKQIPKGALLHVHDIGAVSQEYILKNLTYRPNLYVCNLKGPLKLKFFEEPNNDCDWELLSVLRTNTTKENEINLQIQQHISMDNGNLIEANPEGYAIWIKFQSFFQFLYQFISYR